MSASIEPVRVDVWELRCHFLKARYLRRLKHGEFTVARGKPRPAHPKYGLGPGGVSLSVYYYIGVQQVAEVHHLERADGSLGGSGKPDPKMVIHGGIEYRRISGSDDTLREPELRYEQIWQRRLYGLWRKLRCFFLGPMDHPVPISSVGA